MYYQKNPNKSGVSAPWFTFGLARSLYLTVWISALITLFLSVFDIIKWNLSEVNWQWQPMQMMTSVCFFFACIAILLVKMNGQVMIKKKLPIILSLIIGIISLLSLAAGIYFQITGNEMFLCRVFGFKTILNPSHRMAIFTSLSFSFITLIIILMAIGRDNLAHFLNIPVAIISYFFLISYVLHVQPELLNILPLSFNTSIAMAAICTMVFMISPYTSLVRVFVSDSGSVIARQMILPLIVIPLMVGWIRISGEKQEFLNSEFGVVLIVLTYTTCFLIVAWLAARSFTRIDKRRQKADEASAKLNQRMKLLSDVSANLLAAEDPQKIVNKLCRNVMEFLNCQVFFNYVIEDGSEQLHLNAFEGIPDEEAGKIEWLNTGSAICGCVARDASPIIAENIQHTDDPRANIVRSFGVRTYASFPLLSHEKVIGTLSFGAKNRDHFTDDDVSLIKTVADQVAIAMGKIRNERHLRESEDRFKTIAESLPSLISITRLKDGKFMFVNEVYCNTLGYSHSELLNKKAIDVYAEPSDREKIMNVIQKDGVLDYHQTRLKKSDGTRIWVMSSVRPIIFEGEPAYLGATVDIDEQKRQQTELERLNRNLNALGKSSQLMMHSTNEFDFLNDVCRIITQDCGYMMVWVGYARNNESKSVEPVAFYGLDKTYIDLMDISWADTERGRGPTGNAIRTKKPAVCQNMLTDPAFVPWRDEAIKRGYASSLVLPLLSEGDVLGVICIYSREPDSFNPDDVQLLSNLADDLSYGIVHLRLAESEKKAARIIKESEEKFRVLFESMNEGFALKEMLVDGHGAPYDWKFLSVNPAFEKQTGLKAENIIGKNARKILPKVEPTWIELYGRVALEGISLDFVNYSADLNAWLRVSAFPIKKGTFACMIENITSKVLAERELRNTKDYLENLINYANAPIVVWDPGAEIKLFNHAFEHLTGYDSEDVLGKKIDILFPAESMKESHKKIREAATKNWETIEIPILTKDKKIRTVLWNSANIYDPDDNSILSTIAQGNDITERKLAEREVRNAIEKLDLALNNANIGIWTWDFKNNRWEWDERISDMLGISQAPDKYSLDVLEQYIFEEDFPHIRRALERSRQECTSLDTFFRIKKNDDFRYIELKGMVTKDYEGNPLKMSGVCIDITAMKQSTEKSLFNLNEDLLRSNKELEQFAYVASHDLQEPLRMISSFTQLLASRYKNKLDSEAMEFIEFAVDGAQRMQRLINDLLQYSRIKTRGKLLSPTDMNIVLKQTIHNLSIKIAEKKAQVLSEPLPVVTADEGQMIQLLQNLIENGIKFTKKEPVIQISFQENPDSFLFTVQDNGIGIEPQYYERIFQIFQRLHHRDEYGGTGIGLSICQRIVERHGGKIWVASSNGHGTTFNFTIKKS